MGESILSLIDSEKINLLLEGFNKSTGFVTAIVDLDGNVLSKSGWRQICTKFHRVHPDTAKKCTESDTVLAGQMAAGEKYHFYKCHNGLIDVAVPIIIKNEHVANLFSGQFFFEKPDPSFFIKQAEKYNFDKIEYLKAFEEIPIISEEKVKIAMDFLLNMTQIISEMSMQKLEQVKLNEAIKRSEERWQFAIEGNGNGLWDWNYQTNEIYFSKQWKMLLGFEDHEIGNNLDEWNKRVHPEDKPKALNDIQKHIDGITDVYINEHRLLCKDGSYIWIEDRGKIVSKTKNNKPHRFIGTLTDITERKNVEDELKKQKDMFELVINSVPTRIFWKDLNSVYLGCNSAFAKAAGEKNIENIIGKNDVDFIWGKEAKKYIDDDRQVLKTGTPKLGYKEDYTSSDGNKVWWHTSKMPLKDNAGKVIGVLCTSEDITEKKLAEEKLRLSEEKFRLLYNNSPDMHASVFPDDATIMMCNDTLLKNIGYSREEVIGVSIFDVYHDDCMLDVKDVFQQVVKTGVVNNRELILERKDGSKIEVSLKAYAVRDEMGKILYSMSSWRDITDIKLAKKDLIENETKYRKAQAMGHVGNWEYNLETAIFWASEEAKKMYGFNPHSSDFTTEEIEKCIPERVRVHQALIDLIEKDKKYDIEFELISKDKGERKIIHSIAELEKNADGKPLRVSGVVTDITQLKKKTKELKESEEKYRGLYSSIRDAIIVVDNNRKTIDCNPSFNSLFGYSLDEIIGKKTNIYYTSESEFLEFGKELKELTLDKPLLKIVNFKKKSGETFIGEINVSLLNDDKGNLSGFIGLIRDITELKQAENELNKHREQLEELVKERTQDLDNKNEELERINKVFIGRELKMVELKEKMKSMQKKNEI